MCINTGNVIFTFLSFVVYTFSMLLTDSHWAKSGFLELYFSEK